MTTIDEMRALPHDEMVTEVVKGLIDVMPKVTLRSNKQAFIL